ncbi:hypothetical protein AHiyo6_00170 [Arthrobacter sp. Hiyo6]|nr:hypothetical protein AHiyo6_00170 [Arthrobacter sp. Hiyo6]
MATLNFTGRRELDRSQIQLRVRQDDGKVLLDVFSLGLEGMDLPGTAEVTVEAYRQTTKERVHCGTVDFLQPRQDVHLESFDVSDNIQLRVRVVGAEGTAHGKILAVADHLRGAAEEDLDSAPLLKLQRTDLGDLVWKFDIDNGPILCINKRLLDHDTVVNSVQFKALVLPEFFRQTAIWVARNIDDSDDANSTLSHWVSYFDSIGVDLGTLDEFDVDDPSYNDMVETWAAQAASTFAEQVSSLHIINATVPAEEDFDERD